MTIGLLKEGLGWVLSLTEASVAIGAVLLIGLLVGMAGFWVLSRFLKKLGGPVTELDPYEDSLEAEPQTCLNDAGADSSGGKGKG